jgi:hypothetical protein
VAVVEFDDPPRQLIDLMHRRKVRMVKENRDGRKLLSKRHPVLNFKVRPASCAERVAQEQGENNRQQ